MTKPVLTKTIDVVAPIEQEGTKAVVKSWYQNIGDAIKAGDPLVELETDKVGVEVPAPVSGVLAEIVVAVDGEAGPGEVLGRMREGAADAELNGGQNGRPDEKKPAAIVRPDAIEQQAGMEYRLSPAVRRLVREHDLDPAHIRGTGKAGRLTRGDVQDFLQRPPGSAPPGEGADAAPSRIVPHDTMRRRIAEHMAHSVSTAPHVTAVFEADFSAIIAHRKAHKDDYAARGVKLTYTSYFIAACVKAMAAAPAVNSHWHDDHLEIFNAVNIGVGVALGDKGLIAPVLNQAQARSLFEIAQDLQSLTDKARNNKLTPADVRGGTFSISNHGTSGSLMAAPIIINQPQSAILGVGKLEKRVIVRSVDGIDATQIRPMAYVSLTIDHRALDGAQTNAWLACFVEAIETWPPPTT